MRKTPNEGKEPTCAASRKGLAVPRGGRGTDQPKKRSRGEEPTVDVSKELQIFS